MAKFIVEVEASPSIENHRVADHSAVPPSASGKKLVLAWIVVPMIVLGEDAPIEVPSIVPQFISAVVNTELAKVTTPVLELNVILVFVFGERLPLASVKKPIKQVVSVASFATVTVPALPVIFV